MTKPVLFAALLALSAAFAAARFEPKGAQVTLHTKWLETPLVHEAAEFLAEEDPSLFWDFARAWEQQEISQEDPNTCWDVLTCSVDSLLSPWMAKVFRVSMAVRQYSPKLELYRQLAAQAIAASNTGDAACCWALVNGRRVTDAAGAKAALAAAGGVRAEGSAEVYPFDHLYQPEKEPGASSQALNVSDPAVLTAVLYAPLGSGCGSELHGALAAAAKERAGAGTGLAPLAYAWRPLLSPGCSPSAAKCSRLGAQGGRLVVPGYGVELAIKNMEYNARDDSAKAEADPSGKGQGGRPGEEGPEEVGGFVFSKLMQRKPHLKQELLTFRDHLLAAASQEQVLKVWDLKDLGLQATQRIGAASDPLHLLGEVAGAFPTLVEALSRMRVEPGLRSAVTEFQRLVPPSAPFLLVNGLAYDTRDVNLYDFMDVIRGEVRVWDALNSTGLPPQAVRSALLLRGSAAGAQQEGGSSGGFRLDLQSDDFISWANDLESDPRYSSWPASLESLLMPMYPGRLPSIGRNLFNAIFAVDPASQAGLDAAAAVARMLNEGWPLRLGLLPVCPAEVDHLRGRAASKELSPSLMLARLVGLAHASFGGLAVAGFLTELRSQVPTDLEGRQLEDAAWALGEKLFKARWAKWGASPAYRRGSAARTARADAAAQLSADAAVAAAVEGSGELGRAAKSFVEGAADLALAKGIAGLASESGVLVFNGALLHNEAGNWRGTTLQGLQMQMPAVQESVYLGKLSDDSEDLYADILELHNAMLRYNPRILPVGDRGPRYIRLSGEAQEAADAPQLSLTGASLGLPALSQVPLRYFGTEEAADDSEAAAHIPGITHWVVADARSKEGCSLISAGLQHLSSGSRVGFLIHAADLEALAPAEAALLAAVSGLVDAGPSALQGFAEALSLGPTQPGVLTQTEVVDLLGQEGLEGLAEALPGLLQDGAEARAGLLKAARQHTEMVRLGLRLPAGACAVVTNGRVVELSPSDDFSPLDFQLLDLHATRSQYAGEAAALVELGEEEVVGGWGAADVAAVVSSVLAAHQPEEVDPRSGRVAEAIAGWKTQPNAISPPWEPPPGSWPGHTVSPLLVQAVVNPLSKTAQQLAPVLLFLREHLGAEVSLVLNPARDLTDMPLKTFYRYALPRLPPNGPPEAAAATFLGLPPHKTLTLGMDVPEAWLVEPVVAAHDLDNLRLEELGPAEKSMEAQFELEALMVTGSCLDLASLQARMRDQIHPRGVQLQLGTAADPAMVDTLVMANLGYFQLKAAPGVWDLQLAPGRSRELYMVASSTGASTTGGGDAAAAASSPHQVPVALTSFQGKHMYLFLHKDAERLTEDVLDPSPAEEAGSLWSKLGGWTGKGSKQAAVKDGEEDTIHVFTVASGHMYERLQKIMILSVIKRTPARVKFWFIKNYMSPQMKAFVPYMALKYGFDYEFVTYKWPSWLHKQTEKQRIIWAYKILFLDVLFPLGLRKVIFCDSDQVVRADLRELWNMDLQGAPYGYAPLCDGNSDMDGFRFWKTGFWSDHLQGKPYHISALYVVDLDRFRQMAAGDRLRVMYDSLSKDPNSLANLDQDLPNYAQHTVPIFSLPTEWLWCETWCGNTTKPQARTIDLCNNPLTKEPKLASARRIIKEWPDLNREAQEFTKQVERVLAGDTTEEELYSSNDYYRIRLLPMVEGSLAAEDGIPGARQRQEDSQQQVDNSSSSCSEGETTCASHREQREGQRKQDMEQPQHDSSEL
ncbi:hypothetical protein N2152v2_002226 [Parachlorella kessleri]